MREWYTPTELAGLPDMPGHRVNVLRKASKEGWEARERKSGKGLEYHASSLPESTREHLLRTSPESVAGQQIGIKLKIKAVIEQKAIAAQDAIRAATLTTHEVDRVDARLTILRAWHAFWKHTGVTKHVSAAQFADHYNDGGFDLLSSVRTEVPSVSGSSLLRWERQARKDGASRLSANYGNRKGQSKIDQQPILRELVLAVIYQYPHADGKHVYKAIKARFNDDNSVDLPSQRSVHRWMHAWKEENRQIYTAVANPDKWKNEFMVAHGSLSAHVERLNQLWELDSTPADVLLIDGRHSIIGVIDVYSRRLKLLVSKTSKATAVAAVIRRALLDWGVPEVAKTDNGADYKGHHIRRVFAGMGIEQEFCPPFQGWMKPHIERAFRTFSSGLLELMPGFCGHNVAERQEITARQSFADRILKKNAVIEIKMTSKDLQEFCDQWTDQIYMHEPHSGLDGKTPFELVSNWSSPVKAIDNERALDILLAEAPGNHGRRTVVKKGIRIKWQGEPRKHWYIAPELGQFVSHEVQVTYDPTGEMGSIYVFKDHEFICMAECPELLGIDRKEHAQRNKARQQEFVNEGRKAMREAASRANVSSIADEIRTAAAEQSSKIALFPKSSEIHTSEGLAAAAEAATATDKTPLPGASCEARKGLAEEMAGQKYIKTIDQTARQRFKRWVDLNTEVLGNGEVSEADRKFYHSYEGTPEHKSQMAVAIDFGLMEGK